MGDHRRLVTIVALVCLLLAGCGEHRPATASAPPSPTGAAHPRDCAAGGVAVPPESPPAPVHPVEVVASWPHDPGAFTQGLVFDAARGTLLESTGLNSHSTLREVDPTSGRVLRQVAVPPEHFAEGLALVGGRLVQLTYRSRLAFVYDREGFAPLGTLPYQGEGWGQAYDGRHLIMSDGTARLRFLDPATFAVIRCLDVRDGGQPVAALNEL